MRALHTSSLSLIAAFSPIGTGEENVSVGRYLIAQTDFETRRKVSYVPATFAFIRVANYRIGVNWEMVRFLMHSNHRSRFNLLFDKRDRFLEIGIIAIALCYSTQHRNFFLW